MKILGIESASLTASVALLGDEGILAEYSLCHKKTHSQTLMPMAEHMLKMLDMTPADIDAVAVSAGPGSFTGLRIGFGAAKGMALALDIPLVCVSTLEAMAYEFFTGEKADGPADSEKDLLICPMIDARRGQVYAGLYIAGDEFKEVSKPECLMYDELAERVNSFDMPAVFAGDGADTVLEKMLPLLKNPCKKGLPHFSQPRAATVAELGRKYIMAGEKCDADAAAPRYLRLAQAQQDLLRAKEDGRMAELAAGHIKPGSGR